MELLLGLKPVCVLDNSTAEGQHHTVVVDYTSNVFQMVQPGKHPEASAAFSMTLIHSEE